MRPWSATHYGWVSSSNATLTVITAPTVSTQPSSQTVTAGQTASFCGNCQRHCTIHLPVAQKRQQHRWCHQQQLHHARYQQCRPWRGVFGGGWQQRGNGNQQQCHAYCCSCTHYHPACQPNSQCRPDRQLWRSCIGYWGTQLPMDQERHQHQRCHQQQLHHARHQQCRPWRGLCGQHQQCLWHGIQQQRHLDGQLRAKHQHPAWQPNRQCRPDRQLWRSCNGHCNTGLPMDQGRQSTSAVPPAAATPRPPPAVQTMVWSMRSASATPMAR